MTAIESFEQAPRRPVIGLTGGIGSGKSTVADLFAARGVTLVDADAIAHALTGPGGAAMPALRERFGERVLRADGSLDRDAMRELAFGDPGQRHALEGILHPMIRDESRRQVEQATGAYTMLVVPLLIESGNWRTRVERVLVVDCPVEVQIERVMRRNGLSRERVATIIAAQASREQRLAAADEVVDNGGSPETLPGQVDALHQRYLAMQ
ncbi:MAG: dephospho-CoA kinase [Burkholderiaceae bacterium]